MATHLTDCCATTTDWAGLAQVRQQVGVVFQNPDDQLFSASVRQDISFGPLNLGLPAPRSSSECNRRRHSATSSICWRVRPMRSVVGRRRASPWPASWPCSRACCWSMKRWPALPRGCGRRCSPSLIGWRRKGSPLCCQPMILGSRATGRIRLR